MAFLNKTGVARLWSHIISHLDLKVDKVDGHRLITQSEASKLESLVLGDNGQVEISGKVNADNVDGLDEKLNLKVDKVTGKSLSTNDYTTAEKNKLSGIADGANKTVVDSALSASSTNPVQNKVVNSAINNLNALVGDKKVSEQITTALTAKSDVGHVHTATEVGADPSGSASSALTSAKSYTDTKIAGLINGAPTTLDTIGEIATAMAANEDVVEALESAIGTKANASDLTSHTGNKSNPHGVTLAQLGVNATATELNYVDGVTSAIQTQLNAKVPTSRTVNGKALSSNVTLSASDVGADASGSANTALTNAKAYTDAEITEWVGDKTVSAQISTAIENKVDKVSGKGLSTNDYTTTEKDKLAGIATGAEVNQNAFSTIKVGSTEVKADSKTDTLTLVAGSNVTITPDATNDKVTIAATDTVYTHPSYTAKSSGLYKVTVDSTGHVSAATAVAKSDITALGIPAQDTTYSAATTSAAGLMSAADKTKLDGIATGANKITVDSALSATSTNPVQNKVVNTAISNLSTLVGDTAVSEQISDAFDDAITGLSVDGKVITYTKGDGTTGTITTQDTNSNDKVKQTVTTSDATYPLLLAPNGQTATTTTYSYFDSGVTLNPSTNTIAANISGNAATATNATKSDSTASASITTLPSGTDLNTLTTAGYYGMSTSATAQAFANNPLSSVATGIIVKVYTTGGIVYQEVSGTLSGGVFKRRMNGTDSWSDWIQMAKVTDNVASATKLETGRTLKVNLGSTSASSAFNGTKNITDIGVSGTLPIANGGTGATTAAGVLTNLGVTATATELNYVDGVTSNVQTQINNLSTLVGDTKVSTQISTAIANKSDTGHTHSEYANQNAFGNVTVGSTTIAADRVTDTLTLVAGSNVTLTPDATNDKITIAATDTVYTHPNSGVTAGTYKSVTVNAQGHVTAGSNPTTLSGYGITDAATKNEVSALSTLVGDTKVSEQISSAIGSVVKVDPNDTAISGTATLANAGMFNGMTYDQVKTDIKNNTLKGYTHYYNGMPSEQTVGKYYKIMMPKTKWMMAFTVRVYNGYKFYEIDISGYNYGSNYWYAPDAQLTSSSGTSIEVTFGYDALDELWIGIPAAAYGGVDIINATQGLNAVSVDGFSISLVDTLTGTIQKTVTAYKPYNKNYNPTYSDVGAAAASHTHDYVPKTAFSLSGSTLTITTT